MIVFFGQNLKHDNFDDLDGEILFEELKLVRHILIVESKSSFTILICI